MTPDIDNHQSNSRPTTPRLNREVLDQWKAETRDFFSNTQRKLQQLREAEHGEQISRSPQPSGGGANEPRVMQDDSSLTVRAGEDRVPQESPSLALRVSEDPGPQVISSAALRAGAGAHAANPTSQQSTDDSLDRLQAIKRRIAAQLENSRS